jgi:hypothetical protein
MLHLKGFHTTIKPLQHMLNAAAHLITDTKPWDQITPVLRKLHWLPVTARIQYKLCLQMHLIYTKLCPDCMHEVVSLSAETANRSGLRSASSLSYRTPKLKSVLANVPSAMRDLLLGTAYHITSSLLLTQKALRDSLKPFYLPLPISHQHY